MKVSIRNIPNKEEFKSLRMKIDTKLDTFSSDNDRFNTGFN